MSASAAATTCSLSSSLLPSQGGNRRGWAGSEGRGGQLRGGGILRGARLRSSPAAEGGASVSQWAGAPPARGRGSRTPPPSDVASAMLAASAAPIGSERSGRRLRPFLKTEVRTQGVGSVSGAEAPRGRSARGAPGDLTAGTLRPPLTSRGTLTARRHSSHGRRRLPERSPQRLQAVRGCARPAKVLVGLPQTAPPPPGRARLRSARPRLP